MGKKAKKQIESYSSEEEETTNLEISWVGKPSYTEDDNKFYHAFKVDGTTYFLKEYITANLTTTTPTTRRVTRRMAKGNEEQVNTHILVVGNIQHLWETTDGVKMCQLNNLWVNPEDTPSGRMPYHGEKELVKYEKLGEVADEPLISKRIVETFDKFSRRREFLDNVYYVRSEKLLEPKIELSSQTKGSKTTNYDERDTGNNKNNSKAKSASKKHTKAVEEPDTHAVDDETPPSSPLAGFGLATPSPSKRKNLRLISDDGDYVVVKRDNRDIRPLRRLKRMRKLDSDEEEDAQAMEPQPEDPPETSTPRKRKRIITDSDDDEDESFTGEDQTTRRSTRIPVLQQRKLEKFRNIVGKSDTSDDDEQSHADASPVKKGDVSKKDAAVERDNSSDSDSHKANNYYDEEKKTVDLTDDVDNPIPSSSKPSRHEKTERGKVRKAGMSWIEMSERGKLATPALKPSLQFNTTQPRANITRKTRQSKIKDFLADENTTNFINLVENTENTTDDDKQGEEDTLKSSSSRQPRNTQSEKSTNSSKRTKAADKHSGESFIPELMFDDNDVDNDIRQHIKQQKLLHEFARHSTSHQDGESGNNNRWGRSAKRQQHNPMDDESDHEDNNSEYENDDFLVADDAPIETYAPSQDDLDDGEDESEAEDEEEADGDAQNKNDQDGLFEHVFTNKQAFIVFLQYLISACADPDFIPMMVDSENKDTYFRPALRKIRDQISSRKASLVQSSAWDSSFKESLEARPFYSSWGTSNPNLEDCHACLRTNHPASFKVCLAGPACNPEKYLNGTNVLDVPTLPDELHQDQGEDAYLVGSFCHKRTSLYHRLHFFHIHTFEKVKKKVEKEEESSTEELVQVLLDNKTWMTEMTDRFSNLLMETDDFMNEAVDNFS